MLLRKENKKGQFASIILILSIIFLFMIISLAIYTFWQSYTVQFKTVVNTTLQINDTETNTRLNNIDRLFDLPNKFFIFVVIGLWIAVIISALYTNPEHPVFFLFWVFLTFIITIVALVLRNVGVKFMTHATMINATNSNQIFAFIMNNFHWLSLFFCLTFGLVFYSRRFMGGEFNAP